MLAMALCCAVLSAQAGETINFEVRIAGKRAVVESAEWVDDTAVGGWQLAVGGGSPAPDAATTDPRQPPTANRQPGRLFVFFVQTDFARNHLRTQGQMHFLLYADELLATFGPADRAAVFSFDSHLKFRLDFSSDHEAILGALRGSILIDDPPPPPAVPSPSLAAGLDREAMRRAAHSETGLLLVANALRSIPGPKSILLLGWGLGERGAGMVTMKRDWKAARSALDAARASLFALDTTDADYHDLELGLIAAAEQTGGFYAKTHVSPDLAIERLQRTLGGHYELTLRADLEPGTHALAVRVKRRGATLLAPTSVFIRR